MARAKKTKVVVDRDIVRVNNGTKVEAIYEHTINDKADPPTTHVLKFIYHSGGACSVDTGGKLPEQLGYCSTKAFPDVINDFLKKYKRRKQK